MPDSPVKLCNALKRVPVFSHYAYGDPLPTNGRYFASDGEVVERKDAAAVYMRCEREHGHSGVHLTHGLLNPWEDPDGHSE